MDQISSIIGSGIASPSWPPAAGRPTEVRPYVYETLLVLVLVHTEVSTTATALTIEILSYLLEQISDSLLKAFKQRAKYSLPALMQATLDTEFIAQTLSQYTTDKASATQSEVYVQLDSRTDNDARTKLQDELPQMRAVLKKLRERTKSEFSCFKKARSSRLDRMPTF